MKNALNIVFAVGVVVYLVVAHKAPVAKQTTPTAGTDTVVAHSLSVTEVGVDFCPPCKKEEPILAAISAKGYTVKRVDDLQTPMGVAGYPTFILSNGTNEISRYQGFLVQTQLEKWISDTESYLKQMPPKETKQETEVQSCPSCGSCGSGYGRFRIFRR